MSVDVTEISNLAKILHEHGEKVLNGVSKLSLHPNLLQTISTEFSKFCDNGGGERSQGFQVLSPQHGLSTAVHHLEFLHDFFQKTLGLKIVRNASDSLSDEKIDLSKFKKLKYLELKRIPVKHLVGLKVIQPHVECIICERGLTALEQLLAECGSDNSTGFVWSELKEAVLSFNGIKVVDTSVAFAPWLQVLDLSHNQIDDVKAIECLPNLKFVNLSYNSLTAIPVFNKSARKKIEVLVLKYNYIEDLNALVDLDHLRELDLSNNWVCRPEMFYPFLTMCTLHWLSLQGNPVFFIHDYRSSVIGYLHISASFGNFVLDGKPLTKKECSRVGIELTTQSMKRLNSMSASATSITRPLLQSDPDEIVTLPEKPTRRSGKVRLAVIPNLGDGTYEAPSSDLNAITVKEYNNEHLVTKKQIESAREKYGEDWLRCVGAGIMQNAPEPSPSQVTSLPYDDSYLAAILKDVSLDMEPVASSSRAATATTITTAIIEPIPSDCESIDEKQNPGNPDESFLSCNEENGSNYFSIDSSLETPKESKEASPDIETILDSSEEREDDSEERLYLVTRLTKVGNVETQRQLFLSITATELREKDPDNGRVVTSWDLSSVQSVTRPRDEEVHIVFDTVRRDRWERVYALDVSGAEEVHKLMRCELEGRSLAEMNHTLYRCITCSAVFAVEKNRRKNNSKIVCFVCNSKMVLQVDDVPCPETDKINKSGKPVLSGRHSHNRSASTGVAETIITQEMNKCSSHSSIGSVASLDDKRNLYPAVLTVFEKKCESDIEIISNPSQSSIEVIDAPGRLQGTSSPFEEQTVAQRQLPSTIVTQVSAFSVLTESSSSGSGTDSVCTTFENNSMVSSGASKKSAFETSTLIEDPIAESFGKKSLAGKDFEHMLVDVLENVGVGMQKPWRKEINKDIDIVEYSYDNFEWLDHRIKLYLYTHVFEDNSEEFVFLIRASVLLLGADRSFEACVVSSNKKLYVLKVTGREEGEEASKFLTKVDGLSVQLTNMKRWGILAWNQGFFISFRSHPSEYLVLLKNTAWTKSFLSFLASKDSALPSHVEWNEDSIAGPNLRLTQFLLASADDTSLLAIAFFDHCQISEDGSPGDVCQEGAIIVSLTDFFIVPSLKWLFNAGKNNVPTAMTVQKLSDLIQAGVSGKELRLQFLQEAQGKQEVWAITFAAEGVVTKLLSSIKGPWEELFSVPLHVSNDNCF